MIFKIFVKSFLDDPGQRKPYSDVLNNWENVRKIEKQWEEKFLTYRGEGQNRRIDI